MQIDKLVIVVITNFKIKPIDVVYDVPPSNSRIFDNDILWCSQTMRLFGKM